MVGKSISKKRRVWLVHSECVARHATSWCGWCTNPRGVCVSVAGVQCACVCRVSCVVACFGGRPLSEMTDMGEGVLQFLIRLKCNSVLFFCDTPKTAAAAAAAAAADG